MTSAVFSPDGDRLATGTSSGAVRIWDVRSCRPVTVSLTLESGIQHLQFTPDGRRLLVSARDTTRIYDVPPLPLPSPLWLADLAEAMVQGRIGAHNELNQIEHNDLWALRERLLAATSAEEAHGRWLRWFFAPRDSRTISAFSDRKMPETLDALIEVGQRPTLEMALPMRPVDPVLLRKLPDSLRRSARSDRAMLSDAEFLQGVGKIREAAAGDAAK